MTATSMPWSWGGRGGPGRGAHHGPSGWSRGAPEAWGRGPADGYGQGPQAHPDSRKSAFRRGGPMGRLAAAWSGGPGFPPQPPGPPGPPHSPGPHGHGGPPWGQMPFPPFGGPFGGGKSGWKRGGRPRARRGDVRTGILLLLAEEPRSGDRKSTRLNSSHVATSYAVFCLKKKHQTQHPA